MANIILGFEPKRKVA